MLDYCLSMVSSFPELDDAEINSTFNDIEFELVDGKKLVISTTRPELLPACVAVFYHPSDTDDSN